MKNKKLVMLTLLPLVVGGCFNQPAPSESSSSSSQPEPTSSEPSSESSSSSSSSSESSSSSTSEDTKGRMVNKQVDVKMVSLLDGSFGEGEYTDTGYYNDEWFFEDTTTVNNDLALMSAMTAGASYTNALDKNGRKIADLLEELEFAGIRKNYYFENGEFLNNSMGVIIGQKTIVDSSNKEYTLLAVHPRGSGYYNEWYGNFNMGETGLHEGFKEARDEMLRFMKQYITSYNITGDVKVWTAGYSRGAATANLFGGFILEDTGYFGQNVRINPKDVYVYTVATPRCIPTGLKKSEVLNVSGARGEGYHDTNVAAYTYGGAEGVVDPTDAKYNSIHNFTATGDYVTKLPPQSWDFTRYGNTNVIEYGDERMLGFVRKRSEETADMFKDGKTYSTELPIKTFDLKTFKVVETENKISADAMVENRFNVLMGIAGSRENYVSEHYDEILGSAAGVFGTDMYALLDAVKGDISGTIKVGLLNYLAYNVESYGLEENAAMVNLIKDLMTLLGKEVGPEYTDQEFLEDVLDLLINDYPTDESARARIEVIANLLPEEYRPVLTGLLDYANSKDIQVKTVDDVLLLLASYITDNKEEPHVDKFVTTLSALIPDDYLGMIIMMLGKSYEEEDPALKKKHVMFDLVESFINGTESGSATGPQMRMLILTVVCSMYLSGADNLYSLITNGAWKDNEEDPKIHNDPRPISGIAGDILDLLLKTEEGERLTLVEGADQALADLLMKGRTDINADYIDKLAANPAKVRKVIMTVLFKPGESYSLESDIENAYSFIDMVKFIAPAHYHEMYISYLKTKCSWIN